MSRTQKKYRGRLSPEQIAEGIAACLQNARALVEDAKVLVRAKRHPRALTCLLAAKQELGKVDVLGAMARIDDQKQEHWADLWKSFHSHVVKGTYAAVQTTPDQLRGSFGSVFAAIPGSFQIASSEEELRQASLYVDFSERRRCWTSPLSTDPAAVEKHLESTQKVLERLEHYQNSGLFSAQALKIQHEELSAAISSFPPFKDVTKEDLIRIKMLEPHVKRCLIRLIRELGISFADDATIMGKPWREFIQD
jgi:AbiV family abortive infection protein